MATLQDLIVSIRNLRAELKVDARERVPVAIFIEDSEVRRLIEENRGALERLANVAETRFEGASLAKISGARHTARFDVRLVYEKKVDVAAEREKQLKELGKLDEELTRIERQLDNREFVARAPAHVVQKLRDRRGQVRTLRGKITEKLDQLK
jgi:valyl-tRNA synthetase